MFEYIMNVLHDELEMVNEQYKDGHEITSGDLEKVDKVAHALKSLACYKDMVGEKDGMSERSYARGRSRTTGRYMSRTSGGRSYDPRQEIDPYWDRR